MTFVSPSSTAISWPIPEPEATMKRVLAATTVVAVLLTTVVLVQFVPSQPAPVVTPAGFRVQVEDTNPWTSLKLNNAPATFRFAIVSDRTGGARKGVFERAVDRLNLLQPEFVVCVGDLIQGGKKNTRTIQREWKQFRGFVSKLEMPFFYLPGNHDISDKQTDQIWGQHFGRRYYHFVYKDVLFLLLNTEDRGREGKSFFSKEQLDYVRRVLAREKEVRWTLVLMHQPVWTYHDGAGTGWPEVEKALTGRRYTVFAGHKHHYQRVIRNGQHYYVLATTGGHSGLRGPSLGEFDHIVWVTMKQDGPVLANLLLDGILSENIPMAKGEKKGP
jgi:hypothetical protein